MYHTMLQIMKNRKRFKGFHRFLILCHVFKVIERVLTDVMFSGF